MIEMAYLYTGAELYKRKDSPGFGVKEVWKGTVRSNESRADVYLKLCPTHELIADACCAWLGKSLGLNIPKPYLLKLTRDRLPDSQLWRGNMDDFIYAFALQDVGENAHSLSTLLNCNDPVARKDFFEWGGAKDVIVFDEWIANSDRSQENILYDGEFWLIDHGEAFGGSRLALWGSMPGPDEEFPNILLNDLAKDLRSAQSRAEFLYPIMDFVGRCSEKSEEGLAEGLLSIGLAPGLTEEKTMLNIAEFLKQRAPYLMAIFGRKMGMPELDLQFQHIQHPKSHHAKPFKQSKKRRLPD